MESIRKIIEISRKAGRVTIKYPLVPVTVPERFRGRIDVDLEKCIGCGACASFCPPEAIKWYSSDEGIVLEFHFNKCIFCGLCIDQCPEQALRFSREFELASPIKTEQVVRVIFKSIKCRICGRYFMTERQFKRIREQAPNIKEEELLICPECRKKYLSRMVYLSYPR